MHAPPEPQPRIVGFFENFLHERNIRWLLLSGLGILLASSLVLVTSRWQEWSPATKYGVLLAYTAAVYASGRFTLDVLKLLRTGQTLMALPVLLLPTTFLAGGWILDAGGVSVVTQTVYGAMALVHVAASMLIAVDTCRRFLGQVSPTYCAAYVVLSATGLVVPMILDVAGLPTATVFVLWGVMSVGAVKVNRHVFWLTEEHRAPRILGFVPVLVLGSIFIGQVAFLFPGLSWGWLGVATVLTAGTTLATADRLGRVFEQRTGGIVRPLPASIYVPMLVGLAACAAGCLMSVGGYMTGDLPQPVLVSMAIATALVAGTAIRTKHAEIAQAALILGVTTYHLLPMASPVLANQAADLLAWSLRDPAGSLTYLSFVEIPLLALLVLGHRFLSVGYPIFAKPMKSITTCVGIAALGLAFVSPKAWLLAGTAVAVLLTREARRTKDLTSLVTAALAMLLAGAGVPDLLRLVIGNGIVEGWGIVSTSAACALVLWRLMPVARTLEKSVVAERSIEVVVMLATSLLALLNVGLWLDVGLTPVWLASSASVLGLGAFHLRTRPHAALATGLVGYTQGLGLCIYLSAIQQADAAVMTREEAVLLGSLGIGMITAVIGRLLARRSGGPVMRSLQEGLTKLELVQAPAMLTGFFVSVFVRWLNVVETVDVMKTGLIGLGVSALWCLEVARQKSHPVLGQVGCLALLALALFVGAKTVDEATDALPALAATAATMMAAGALLGRVDRSDRLRTALREPMHHIGLTTITVLGLVTLGVYSTPARCAAGIVATTSVLVASVTRIPLKRQAAVGFLGLQILMFPLIALHAGTLLDVSMEQLAEYSTWFVLVAAGMAAYLARAGRVENVEEREFADAQRRLFELAGTIAFIATLFVPGWTLPMTLMLVAAGLILLVHSFEQARLSHAELPIWVSAVWTAAGLGVLAHHDVIPTDRGYAAIILALASFSLWGFAHVLGQTGRWAIARRPVEQMALAMPGLATLAALGSEFLLDHVPTGVASGAVLLASAFWFWRGIEDKARHFTALAALHANVALALLWRDLSLSDPQLYLIPLGATILGLVETFRREIPERLRDPLRYLGALVILVSPITRMLDGQWMAYATLMLVSMVVILLAIGLRARAILYTGSAFLAGDLVAIVVRGCVDHPQMLWMTGIALGTAVVGLAAYCERRRDVILARIQTLSAALERWS